jgi:hypothetical protein
MCPRDGVAGISIAPSFDAQARMKVPPRRPPQLLWRVHCDRPPSGERKWQPPTMAGDNLVYLPVLSVCIDLERKFFVMTSV